MQYAKTRREETGREGGWGVEKTGKKRAQEKITPRSKGPPSVGAFDLETALTL